MQPVVLLRRIVPRRRRSRILALVAVLAVVGSVAAWAGRPQRVPDPPVRPVAAIDAEERAAEDAEAAEAAESPASPPSDPLATPDRSTAVRAATVPDIPLAWRRIAEQAQAWPPATDPPNLGAAEALPTVPASRVRDTIGLNIDTWRTEDGYRDFGPVLAKVAELRLRHARVNMSASGGEWGVARLQQLGQIGVRLNLIMGDAFGRYGTAPYATLDRRLDRAVMPYVDSLEGTNEPDLAKEDPWAPGARAHQRKVVESAAVRRTRPVAVVAPSAGRLTNLGILGDYTRLADAGNAHAYSSAEQPSGPIDQWLAALKVQMPGGAPTVITEAGFQDDLGQRRWHSPLPRDLAANYIPRTILEAMRRGIPRVYLYEMINRWSDPFHVDTAAHFGLLDHELRPKPAWTALMRLQTALLDGGRPDREVTPVRATIEEGPGDLRVLAFRRRDGTASLAVWRAVSEWDSQAAVARVVRPARVRIKVDGAVRGAVATNIADGATKTMASPDEIVIDVAGAPIVVDAIR